MFNLSWKKCFLFKFLRQSSLYWRCAPSRQNISIRGQEIHVKKPSKNRSTELYQNWFRPKKNAQFLLLSWLHGKIRKLQYLEKCFRNQYAIQAGLYFQTWNYCLQPILQTDFGSNIRSFSIDSMAQYFIKLFQPNFPQVAEVNIRST